MRLISMFLVMVIGYLADAKAIYEPRHRHTVITNYLVYRRRRSTMPYSLGGKVNGNINLQG